MLARERAAMDAEYWQSFVAQRYYYRSAQLPLLSPSSERTYTWQHAYEQTHGNWLGALQVLRNVRDLLQRGMHAQALASLRDELSSDGEEAEEEELETDAEVEMGTEVEEAAPMQVPDAVLAMRLQQEMERSVLQPSPGTAPSPVWVTGMVHRLD